MPANVTVSRYELKELLGEGGMGVVYRALDTRTNSYVALKTLRDATDPQLLEMFKREWALLGEVPHPNIVDVRDVDEIEENGVRKPCFIMPLLPGCTLAALIKSSSPRLTTEFVANMVAQVCKGLQAAHEKDLIHRDLKPSNVFIMEDDTAKIIDFGLVHAIGNKSSTGLKGTWQYMSPEQIEGTREPSRSFDIYSLGVVAYEALTGHQPFRRAKFEDTVDAVRHFVPQPISERNPKVPQNVSKAIHVAMAKHPNSRYATARDFADTLLKAYRNEYIERFDPAKIRPRIDRAKKCFSLGDSDFASEILTELEAEGNIDTDITLLRSQLDEHNKQKRVRQLFEAAQTRLEQDEIPLALEKLQEIIKIDPQNPEALKLRKKIEQQRSQQQVGEWLGLAHEHLERHDFSEARRALKEVFNLKYDDPEAAQLKAQVDAREKEVETARAEKESLYSIALRHNQSGEISSALSKLEKLLELSRHTPGASVPERDKVFQAFYNDVRTERDRIDNAYAEASRHLSEKNFEKALGICDGILYRYPQNPQFQALRLKIEHSQRQELSAYIAEVGRAVDTEPNLDRRVGLLEEACKRYPSEGQFSRQLSLARELRDLVSSIVNRARNYEEQGQFAEAAAQWNTLSNIHPQYPGIDFEIHQLERRREQQGEEEKKARLVERIDRALGNAAYADAEKFSQDGLLEFPNNPELLALLRHARQGLEQTREALHLFEEAKALRASGDWEGAVGLLRQALDLDKRNIVVHNTLVNLLTERAHALLDSNPAAAEPLAAEAGRLDPEHPSVNKIIALIAQAKRKSFVEHTVLQAREIQNTDRDRAIEVLKQGLTVYPGEGRLLQTLSGLQKDFQATAFGVIPEEKTVVYQGAPAPPPPQPLAAPPRPQPPAAKKQAPAVTPPASPQPPQPPSRRPPFVQQLRDTIGRGSHTTLIGVSLGLVASALLIGLATWYLNRTVSSPKPIAPPPVLHAGHPVNISTTPPDATIVLDGNPIGHTTPALEDGSSHHVAIASPGFTAFENKDQKVNGGVWSFSLAPEPLHISVSVSEPSGTVWLDDQQVDKLTEGAWSSTFPLKSSAERHSLSVKDEKNNELFKISFAVTPGKAALVEPLKTKDLLVSSSLGKEATVYSGNPGAKLTLSNEEPKPVPPEGLPIPVEDGSASFSISSGQAPKPFSVSGGQAPVLSVTLNAAANQAPATVTVVPPTAKLFVDGTPIHSRKGTFFWVAESGIYKAKVTADGMNDETFSITIRRGVPYSRHVEMHPRGPIGPPPARLIIAGGEPDATVSVDGTAIGQLDAQGAFNYGGVAPGTRQIEISKPGYHTLTSRQVFISGKSLTLPNVTRLAIEAAYARFNVTPPNARVSYARSGSNEKHVAVDPSKVLALTPGSYDFFADADQYLPSTTSVTMEPKATRIVSIVLQPLKGADSKIEFVNPKDVKKDDGDWYHGNSNGFIPLTSHFKTNTILLSKQPKTRKMSWRVALDNDNMITYTFDGKTLSVSRRINGEDNNEKLKDISLDGAGNAAQAYVVQIKLESGAVVISSQNGSVIDTNRDEKHNWSRATVFIKGDNHFTVWPGR